MSTESLSSTPPPLVAQRKPGSLAWLGWLIFLLMAAAAFAWWRGYIPDQYLPHFAKKTSADAQTSDKDGAKTGEKTSDKAGGAGGGRRRGAGGPVPVVVAQAKKGDLPIYLNGLGTITALNTVVLHTRVDGELQQVHYVEGQHVKQGDLLAEIDPRPFQNQLGQAQGQLAKDQASLKNARLDLQRYQEAKQAVTQQQIDTAAANVAQFEGAIKADQATVDTAQLQITYSRITSPITGRIGLRLMDAGNIVHASDATGLAIITQVSPITAVFSLTESFLPQILKASAGGQKVDVEAYDRDMKNKLATGTLLAVDSQIDQTTGTIKLRAAFENKDESLFPNQFVNVRLLVDTRKDVVLLPLAALQHSPKTDFVYVVKEDQSVEMRPVTIGTSEGEQLIIEKGVNPGETVVIEGVDKLQPGSKVTMPSRDGPDGGAQGGEHKKHAPSGGGPQ